jgi:hypothetical protein
MLPYLRILNLEGNQIEGSIPSTLGLCPKLRSIPPHKKGMEKLRLLDVSNNELMGGILTEIGHLGDLEAFAADNNRFTGTLPRELFRLNDLETVQLTHNWFQGTLPVFGSRHESFINP